MTAVELNKQIAEPRVGPDDTVQHHKLTLVASGTLELSPAQRWTGRAAFTPAEMRHNFAIWAVKDDVDSTLKRHLYYCVRCKQAFSVDDWSGCTTALDSHGAPLQGREAIKRLDTFSCGPCPAFSRLTAPRSTSNLIPIQTARGRFSDLTLAGWRGWKAIVALWHRLPKTDRTAGRQDQAKTNIKQPALVERRMRFMPCTVEPWDSVAHARALLDERRIKHLPVMSNERLVGIVTAHDLQARAFPGKHSPLAKALAEHPDRVRINSVMTTDVRSVAPSDDLAYAAQLMRRAHIGALPVLEHGRLAGIINRGDLSGALGAPVKTRAHDKRKSHSSAPSSKAAR